jgi:hypothetical protein
MTGQKVVTGNEITCHLANYLAQDLRAIWRIEYGPTGGTCEETRELALD